MPLTKINTDIPIRGRIIPNANQRRDCQAVIRELDFADLGRGQGTLHTVGVARLDMQGNTGTAANLQVQIGTQTAAVALIANTVQTVTDPANQRGVVNGAISVLNQSLDSGTEWRLTGTLP